jgi:hypothetical protein
VEREGGEGEWLERHGRRWHGGGHCELRSWGLVGGLEEGGRRG